MTELLCVNIYPRRARVQIEKKRTSEPEWERTDLKGIKPVALFCNFTSHFMSNSLELL